MNYPKEIQTEHNSDPKTEQAINSQSPPNFNLETGSLPILNYQTEPNSSTFTPGSEGKSNWKEHMPENFNLITNAIDYWSKVMNGKIDFVDQMKMDLHYLINDLGIIKE